MTDNSRLHATFALATQLIRPCRDDGNECGCVWRQDGQVVKRCQSHATPGPDKRSPLHKSVRRTSHTHKTGSPIARNNRRMRQLAREGLDADHKKKHKGSN